MDTILQVKDLCKKYEDFALDHVSFTLPRGCIMGFIGENGAGLSERAFEDQCTTANPRYPLVSELEEIYRKAYYGE